MGGRAGKVTYRRRQAAVQASGGTRRDANRAGMREGNAKRTNAVAVWAAYAAMVACNVLFEVFALGGTTAAEVSNEVLAWFTPAGYVFSIWSLIYIGLAVWLVAYTAEAAHDKPRSAIPLGQTALLFVVSCALNIVWLAFWHARMIIPSVVVIVVLLAVVGMLYARMYATSDRIIDRIPVSLYFAWLCVATLANIAHAATRFTGSEASAVQPVSVFVLAIVLFALAAYLKRARGDYVFCAVVIWAVVGIGVQLMGVNVLVAVLVIMIAGFGALAVYFPWEKYRLQPRP